MENLKHIYDKNLEFILYSVVGVSLTIGNWVLYAFLMKSMPIESANLLSWVTVVILAFLGNKMFVFRSRQWHWQVLIREAFTYLGARGLTGIFEVAAPPILYHLGMQQTVFGVDGMAAKILVTLVAMVMNYSCTKLLVFRTEPYSASQKMEF